MRYRAALVAMVGLFAGFLFVGCGGDADGEPTLVVGAIPDQEVSQLQRRFDLFTDYLEQELDVNVEYVPSDNYSALVTAFQRGDVQLAWFGGLTGVQARRQVDGARAIAQRPRDRAFQSVLVARNDAGVSSVNDLKGKRVTFGSESSTSGHLMPRYYAQQNGINPDEDFAGGDNYSGSHDRTYKIVEAGSYEAGFLNEAVWARAVEEDQVDTGVVQLVERTHEYPNYHWTVHPSVEEKLGEGSIGRIQQALLELDENEKTDILGLFQADEFVEASNDQYEMIEETALQVGIFQEE